MLPDGTFPAAALPGNEAGEAPPKALPGGSAGEALLDGLPGAAPFVLPDTLCGAPGGLPPGIFPRGPVVQPLNNPGTAAPGIAFIPPREEGWPVLPLGLLPPYGPPRYQPPAELPRGLLPAPVPLFAPLLPEPVPPFGLLADAARIVRLSLCS